MGEKKYHGLTLKEIRDKYYIHYEGHEDQRDMYEINSKLAGYYQEVSYYYTDSKRLLERSEDTLRRMTADYEYEIENHKARYLRESLEMPKGKRWSDKARETLSISDAMSPERKKDFSNMETIIKDLKEEVVIWHEIRNNLRFVSKRVDNDSMNMAVEAKVTRNFTVTGTPSNVKVADAVSDKFVEANDVITKPPKIDNVTTEPVVEDNDLFICGVPIVKQKSDAKAMKKYCEEVGIEDPNTEVPF